MRQPKISKEVKQSVLDLWAKGHIGREIGAILGITRSSVMGLLNRMRKANLVGYKHPMYTGIKPEPMPKVAKVRVRKKSSTAFVYTGMSLAPTIVEERPLAPAVIAKQKKKLMKAPGIRLLDLKFASCRYIVDSCGIDDTFYCGEAKERGSYCEYHANICYVKTYKEVQLEGTYQ